MWHLVGHTSEVAEPNKHIRLPWRADGDLMVTNFDGELVAWDGICPHRGMKIMPAHVTGGEPTEPVCQYHGRCVKKAQVRTRYQLATAHGWIWVSDLPYGSIDPWVDVLYEGFTPMPELTLKGGFTTLMACDWRVAVENTLEAEHVPFVHENSLAVLGIHTKDVIMRSGGGTIEVFSSSMAGRLDKLASMFDMPKEFDYVHQHAFPYACLSSTRGLTFSLQNYFPRADGNTTFVHRLYGAKHHGNEEAMNGFFESVGKLNAQVFAEDSAICQHVEVVDWRHEPAETRIAHFRANLPVMS